MGKFKLKIMNIIYLALSGLALFWYSLNFFVPDKAPFLKFGIHVEMDEEASVEVLSDETLDSFGVSRDDLFESGPLVIEANIQIKNQMLLDVWKADDAAAFVDNSFIQPNVDALVESLKPSFMNVAKSAAKGALRNIMEDELSDLTGGEDLYATLAAANPELTKEKMSQDISDVIDGLLAENATIDSVSELLAEKYSPYSVALGGEEKTTEEMKEEIKDTFKELGLVDENGNINSVDDVIASLLGGILGGEEPEDKGGEPEKQALRRALFPNYEEPDDGEENPIAAKLKAFINEKLDDKTKGTVVLAFKALGIALAVFMLGWALKALQVIIRFFILKPYVRFEIIGFISNIVQLILATISLVIIAAFKFNLLSSIPFVSDVVSTLPFPIETMSLELTFSAMIPGILIVINFVYSIFYGIAKRRYKRENKKA